jgi:hypothetical protein
MKKKWISQEVSMIQSFIGDFNTILEDQEHNGFVVPARHPIEDFQLWTDTNHLLHLLPLELFTLGQMEDED